MSRRRRLPHAAAGSSRGFVGCAAASVQFNYRHALLRCFISAGTRARHTRGCVCVVQASKRPQHTAAATQAAASNNTQGLSLAISSFPGAACKGPHRWQAQPHSQNEIVGCMRARWQQQQQQIGHGALRVHNSCSQPWTHTQTHTRADTHERETLHDSRLKEKQPRCHGRPATTRAGEHSWNPCCRKAMSCQHKT